MGDETLTIMLNHQRSRWGCAMGNAIRIWVAAGAFALIAGCGAKTDTPPADVRPRVETVVVEPADPAGLVRLSGTIGFQREPVLSFRANGVIQSIAVYEGDVVKAGQRLAWLRATEVAANASQARSALDVAERNLARTKTLFDKGFVAQARLDDAQLAVDRARAAAETADFGAETAEIRAPADGVILRRLAEPNQVAAAGTPILTMGDARSGVLARAAAPADAARRIKPRDKARVRVDGEVFTGAVRRVSGQGDSGTGAFDVEIALDRPGALRSGQVVDVEIDAKPQTGLANAQRIPTLALLDARADQGVVLVVDAAGIAKRRPVRTAGVLGDSVLVVEGLAPGERVISAGAAYVRDGDAVVIAER